MLESTSRGLAPLTAYSTGLITAQTYLRYRTERQKDQILGGMCCGRLEAIALRRVRVGSPTRTRRSSKLCATCYYVLNNGQKTLELAHHLPTTCWC